MEKINEKVNTPVSRLGFKQLFIMYNDLGLINYNKKLYREALNCFEEAFKYFDLLFKTIDQSKPENIEFLSLVQQQVVETKAYILQISQILGDELKAEKKYEEALNFYKNIITCNLDEDVSLKASQCLRELGAYASAIAYLESALDFNPEKSFYYKEIAHIYHFELKDLQKAIEYYKRYIETEKDDKKELACAYSDLGYLYGQVDMYNTLDVQVELFEKAIELDPCFIMAYKNLTIIYQALNRFEDALSCFKKIFELGATIDDFFDYACLNIKLKNFKEGWKYYEYRFSKETDRAYYPKFTQPKWKGEDISDKTLLIQCEQGFGDSLQFSRYIDCIKSMPKKIIFKVQDELFNLFKHNLEDVEVVQNSTPINQIKFDCHIPLLSLPRICEATVDNIPISTKYISASKSKVAEYKSNYFNNDFLKIGIAWHGAVGGDKRRDIPFETFFDVAKINNAKLYSFQKNITVEELNKLPLNLDIVKLGKTFRDFSDTAAALENLDVFITCDSGLFHLASALGVRTFLLLHANSEWRWFTDNDMTPWYDSARVFKKSTEVEDWNVLMSKVIEEIKKINE